MDVKEGSKKILYITYDGLTDPLGQSQILPYLVKLSKQGFHFIILSFEKKQRYQKEQSIIRSIAEGAGIEWIPLYFTANPPVLSKIYDRYRIWKKALSLYKKNRFDLIHCRSYVAAEVGLALKKRFEAKFLFDMRGFWADEKVDNGQWNQGSYLYRLIYKHYKKKEKEFLRKADGVITLTKASEKYLKSDPVYRDLLIEVIPCCTDFDHFDFHKISSKEIYTIKEKSGISATAKVITYLGSVGGWYMTREMFSFFKVLLKKHPEYVLLVLTKDSESKIKKEAVLNGVPDDHLFVTYSNRQQLPQYLALSDYGLFFIRDTFSKIASSPTKHGELMAMGIPVICNDIGDTGCIVNSTHTGIIVKHFSEKDFEEAINKMNETNKFDKEYIRNCAKEIFDLQAGVNIYLKVYERILNNKKLSMTS